LQAGPSIALIAGATNRPNVVAGVDPTLSNPTLAKWFNTAAYTTPAPFTYGNSSRTMPNVTGPGLQTIDFSVFKDFTFRERYKLQVRGEAFNLFNKPAFDVPGRDVTQQTFGVVTATLVTAQTANAGSRELQFSLRLSF
jgi:hypothetical protein